MSKSMDKVEFDLTIKKFGQKFSPYEPSYRDEKQKFEKLEELKFNSLSAVEVIRKLLDYIRYY